MGNRRSELAAFSAALVNGLLVFAILPALYWQMSTGLRSTAVLKAALVASPFAAFTAWRTFVHAERRIDRGDSGWQGVVEAGATGFLTALAYFAPMLAHGELLVAVPVLVYSSIATVIGLLLGCVLRTLALIVLMLFPSHSRA